MKHEGIPPDTALFIISNFESLGQMEVLLLLHRSPEVSYSAARVNEELRSNLASVEHQLASLADAGLVAADGNPAAFRYAPASQELAAQVDTLSDLYRSYRERIIELIYSRQQQMINFSNSFRLRKGPDPNG